MLQIFWEFSKLTTPQTLNDILSSPLWYNDQIEIGGSPIFFKNLYDHGILFIADLFDSERNFLNFDSMCETYNLQVPFTSYLGLKNSILSRWPQLDTLDNNILFPFIPITLRIFKKNTKGTRTFYDSFLSNITYSQKYLARWESELLLPDSSFLVQLLPRVFSTTSDTSLRWFQYRIFHRILATNKFLFKLNIVQSELCTFCQNHPETIFHLFAECEYSETIWKSLERWILESCDISLNLSNMDILFGKINTKFNALNTILLLVKQYIYRKRNKQEHPNFEQVKHYIYDYFLVEKYMYSTKGNFDHFQRKWESLRGLFTNFHND